MQKYIFIIICCTLCILVSSPIKDIIIIGNEITTDEFILDTIHHTIGDTVNTNLANQDMLNLYETGLFDDVDLGMFYSFHLDERYNYYQNT